MLVVRRIVTCCRVRTEMKLHVGNAQPVRFALFSLAQLLCLACFVSLQTTTSKPLPPPPRTNDPITASQSSSDDRAPLTSFEEEMRAKRAIKLAEKEHQQNLKRAKEISELAKELENASKKTPLVLDREALKKIDRLEKLAKKIRGEAGGE